MTDPSEFRVATRDLPPTIQAAPSAPAQTSGQERARARPVDRQALKNPGAAGLGAANRLRAVDAENLQEARAGLELPGQHQGRQPRPTAETRGLAAPADRDAPHRAPLGRVTGAPAGTETTRMARTAVAAEARRLPACHRIEQDQA